MSWLDGLLVFVAALLAGIFNALAGGGTLLLFPALIEAGLTPIIANATSASALIAGYASSAYVFGPEVRQQSWLKLAIIVIVGSLIGAYCLSQVSNAAFYYGVPVLLLFASLLFWFGPSMQQYLNFDKLQFRQPLCYLLLFVVSIYGGFFGAGMGIMLMFALALLAHSVYLQLALKHVLSLLISLVSVMVFIVADLIAYSFQIVAVGGAVIGGYLGSAFSRRMPVESLRIVIFVLGLCLTVVYAYKAYF